MAKAPSVWSYVSKMPPEHFKHLYVDFPQNVRLYLGDWLENQPWDYVTGTDAFCVETANSILDNLVEELKKAARNCDTPLIFQVVEHLMSMSQYDPMATIQLFKTICKGEMEIVLKQYPRLAVTFQARQEEMMFNYRIKKLQHKIKETTVTQQRLKEMMVNGKFSAQVQDLQKQWIILIDESLKLLKSVQDQAVKIISIWKRRQQLSGNGAIFDENLLPLQDRLEIIFGIYEELIHMIREFSGAGQRILPLEFLDKISVGFAALINSSFLVDKQPPQVLKTQTKFQASINFMLGSKILAGVAKMPIIRANIITEKKAQELFVTPSTEGLNDGAGEIENGISVFEFNQATRSCGTVFKNMLLKKIKRCERKGSESVTEEKCAILFTAEINFSGSTYIIQDFSLPLVVIVHGNQDNNAKATILWDNAFSEIARRPFYVDEKVPWKKMCQALNMKFTSEVGTKQELTPLHFRSLAQKIFGENVNYEDTKDCMVSWAQFNKEPLRERSFTFWQWFDGVIDLTKKHLKDYWSDGLILGFISKQYVHNFLGGKPSGTFLLRFSDSGIGGVTIAHVVPGDDGSGQIQNIQPFHANELKIRCLGDCVRDLKQLTYLYEKGEKDIVFDKYYKKVVDSKNGYTRAQIVVTVDGVGSQQNPSPMNSLPIDEEESFPMHRSPMYGSPAASPVIHIPSASVLYNPAMSPSLIQPLQPALQEHPPFFVDQRHARGPHPQLPQFYQDNNNPGCIPIYPDVPNFNQMEICHNGAFHIEEVMAVISNDASQSSICRTDPMEEGNTWSNSDSAKSWH